MPKSIVSTQRLVLSARFLLGEAGDSRNDRLDALARFSDPEAIRAYLDDARKAGFGALLTLGDERLAAALKLLLAAGDARKKNGFHPGRAKGTNQTNAAKAAWRTTGANGPNRPAGANGNPVIARGRAGFQVLPVIPNVLGYVREATEHGLAGAGLRRLLRVGPMGFLRASLVGALNVRKVLRKDFATLLSILYELEMGEFHRFAPPAVFLHHQITDLALGFDNRAFFEKFAAGMRDRFHTEPGLVTSNFVRLAEKLAEWDLPISLVVAPFNRENFLMPGGIEAYRRILDTGRFRLIADRLSPEFPTPLSEIEWALSQPGVASVVADWTAE